MRRTLHKAPQGFIDLLQHMMAKRGISLNQLAERAGMSPAFLSRILNQQRGLPTDKAILRLAEVLDLKPADQLLIAAGRIPEDLRPALSAPQIPALLRATGRLSESELKQVLDVAQGLVLQRRREKKT